MRRAALALCALAFACSPSPQAPVATETTVPLPPFVTPTPSPVQERTASPPARLKVRNEARGPSRRLVVAAMRDLRRIGVWRRLTRGLYALQLQTDPGGLPEDAHLADARTDAVIDADGAGTQCSIRFYPAAMRRELNTLEEGYRRGVLGAPPTLRQLWAGVLAHELAHCLDWGAGEPFAVRWEDRVRKRLRAAGIE